VLSEAREDGTDESKERRFLFDAELVLERKVELLKF